MRVGEDWCELWTSLQITMIVLLLILWPVAELFVLIKVAEAIGVLYAILLLVVSWPLGTWVLRSQGRAAWRRLSAAVAAGRSPGREVLDGALVLIGGLLLIVPGFRYLRVVAACPSRMFLRACSCRTKRCRTCLPWPMRYDVGGAATRLRLRASCR